VVNYLLKEWLSLEPMINQGTRNIKQLKDGGQSLTADGNHLHFEHDIVVDGKPNYIYVRIHL
jgi:methionyl aminopeptidase